MPSPFESGGPHTRFNEASKITPYTALEREHVARLPRHDRTTLLLMLLDGGLAGAANADGTSRA
jgi:hypothetical protein